MVTGIDVGYGYTKIVAINGAGQRKFIFSSRVSRYIPRKSFRESFEVLHINGVPYIVGENIEGSSRVGFDFVGTEEYFAIIGHSLSKIGAPKKVIVLGLPPQAYNETKIQSLADSIRTADIRLDNGTKIHIPPAVEFVPQGAGIFFAHLTDNGSSDFSKTVSVVDIGYHTMDIVLFANEQFKASMSRSYPLGVKSLYDMVRDAYIKEYSIFLPADSDNIIERLIRDGSIPHMGKEHRLDTKSILDEFYVGRVLKSLGDYISDAKEHGYVVDRIVLGGGGISYMGNISGATVVMDPQFANARGFMSYGLKIV